MKNKRKQGTNIRGPDLSKMSNRVIGLVIRYKKEIIIYGLAIYFGDLIGRSFRLSSKGDLLGRAMDAINGLNKIFSEPYISLHPKDLLVGVIIAILLRVLIYIKMQDKKNFKKGIEYGSASFGTKNDIEPFIDKNRYNNLILSADVLLSMNPKMKDPRLNRNKNALVIGGSGSGKTRGHTKPNLMQLFGSYVVTDPKGTVINETGHLFVKAGYRIKVLNTVNMDASMHYNPFAYIKNETDIMKVADALIAGTTTGKQQGEQFWIDAEKLLYNALIAYIMKEGLRDEKNFGTMLELINAMEIRDEDDSFKNAVDFMFEDLENEDPGCYAVLQYKKFKQAAGKTAKSIMISVGARLARFDIPKVRELMSYDELQIDELGDRKSVLFIIISDTSKTLNFMATILYTQMFNLLCEKADIENGGILRVPVHCILDEFANIGRIPDFEILISTIRSRLISASIILQSMAQLNNIYDKAADIISDNCDSLLFLGGKGKTLKDISDLLGKETIDLYNTSDTRGTSRSYGLNYSKVGRELMTQDELARMPGDKCIAQIRGVKPFYSDKYDITKHPRYRYLSDYDRKNEFDIVSYLNGEASINIEETCVLYTVT